MVGREPERSESSLMIIGTNLDIVNISKETNTIYINSTIEFTEKRVFRNFLVFSFSNLSIMDNKKLFIDSPNVKKR
jgi:hypothetical protein